jgi:peptidoglycan/xylan/chitin deacetylase (PgdA/CDA1 family)
LEKELQQKLYRPHGGYYSKRQKEICVEEGYTIIPASVRVYDAVLAGEKREKAVRQLIKKVEKQNGGIVLLHDAKDSNATMEKKLEQKPHGSYNRSWIPEAVEEIIIALKAKGYIIGPPELILKKDL